MQVVSRQSGFDLHFSNGFQTLLNYVEAYFYLDYSVIPLLGDLDPLRPKTPAIPWAGYQRYRASLQEQQGWFQNNRFAGLGIVTGRISQLVVLDFDSKLTFEDFRVQYPDLMETHIVQSAGRQLPHLYFRLPPHLNLPTMKGQGVDLLSDGCYVVAPPTTIAGQSYKITRGGMPRTLTERDIARIRGFVSRHTTQSANGIDHTQMPVEIAQKPSTPARGVYPQAMQVTAHDLTRIYQFYCQQGGRNEALFRTSLYARDTGWLPSETQECLVPLHVQQAQQHETPAQRQREAIRTIQSAFSRPARPTQPVRKINLDGQLSNSAREALMQQDKTCCIRTYEGLLLKGIQQGRVIMAKEAIDQLKGLVGRDSVRNALNAVVNGKRLFPPPVSPHYAVANQINLKDSDKCLSEGSNLQEKVQMGRPQHLFVMPSNEELCVILGVKVTGSDPLEPSDLATAHQTRMGLHRELIKRRPGQYGKGWLARRLGVTKRTIATYNRLIPIHSRAMFIEAPVFWGNIERLLPLDEPIQGAVLVTNSGKRYPALRTIASRLLAKGEGITLKHQTANFYWVGDTEPIIERLQLQQAVEVGQQRVEAFIAKQQQTVQINLEGPPPAPKPVKSKPKLPKNLHRPLKDAVHEATALHLYEKMNQIGTKQLSLANARRIVATHGSETVASALNLLNKRQAVTNPVGFMVTILRTSQKALENR